MRKSSKLSLKRESFNELTSDELVSMAGGNLTDACVGNTKIVCATVDRCITDYCTYYCVSPTVLCAGG